MAVIVTAVDAPAMEIVVEIVAAVRATDTAVAMVAMAAMVVMVVTVVTMVTPTYILPLRGAAQPARPLMTTMHSGPHTTHNRTRQASRQQIRMPRMVDTRRTCRCIMRIASSTKQQHLFLVMEPHHLLPENLLPPERHHRLPRARLLQAIVLYVRTHRHSDMANFG